MRPTIARALLTTLTASACAPGVAESKEQPSAPLSMVSKESTPSSAGAAGRVGNQVQLPGSQRSTSAAGQAGVAGVSAVRQVNAGSGSSAIASAGTPAAAGGSASGMPAAGAAGVGTAAAPAAAGCDRACLFDVMQGYTDALVAQDPSRLDVSSDLKYTENGVVAMLGDTVWTTAMSVVPDTTLSFADPLEGQVASQFVFTEAGSIQKIYQVRLKAKERTITEIESMVVQSGDQFFNPAGMKPEPVFFANIDAAERSTREELLSVTELYLDYLEGMKRAAEVPFADDCKRYENGTVTANGLGSFQAQSWNFDVTHRILVVDEEAGITWGMFPFQKSESALVVGEAFKIIAGEIKMIQAVMTYMPSKSWD